MHEKSVVGGLSGRGLRGSDRPFVRLWNRVGKQRRFGAYTSPLCSPLVVRPLVLSYLILCWLLSLWSSLVLASLVFVFCGLLLSCPLLSCLLYIVLVPACSGGFLEPSSAPLGGPLGASGSPPGASSDRFGPPGPSRVIPRPVPGRPSGSLGRSWQLLAALGPPLGRPGALLGGP